MLPFFAPLIAPIFKRNAWYSGEMEAWAEALGVSMNRMILLQHLYELSHLKLSGLAANIFGCTAGVKWFDDLGMVHVRTLDWPLKSIGPATRIFRFRNGTREFVTVGIAGFVGVLSGMVPGTYSVTINWAPSSGSPRLKNVGPAFLLRRALETCDTYDAAIKMLTDTPLAASVIYTVCGTERDQGCVIERTHSDHALRELSDDSVVAATNHFISANLAACNRTKNEDFILGSTERQNEISHSLSGSALAGSAQRIGSILSGVENEFTCHKMVFVPATGEVAMWPTAVDTAT